MKLPRYLLPLALAVLVAPSGLSADAVVFVNGDRLSGQIVARGTRRVRLKTPYGRLEIPRKEIARLVFDDGREEIVTPPDEPPPPKTTADLVLVVTGNTFWQAWDPDAAPADPSLRLVVLLDGREVITYTDVNLDPDDLPGAVVNSFVFAPERLLVSPAAGVKASPPEPGRGGIRLALELPPRLSGQSQLALVYQVNEGTASDPEWRDVVEAEVRVELSPEEPTQVRLEQDRGRMEYTERSMHFVETFRTFALVVKPSS
jgi:hypothetical protein